jgi:hypothetical protein
MFAAIARIACVVDVPVTADVEAGYGLEPQELVDRLLDAGAVGCNLEDSDPATKELVDPEQQADYLSAVRAVAGADLVINARVDSFLAKGNLTDTDVRIRVGDAVARGRLYRRARADCVYPIFAPVGSMPELVSEIGGPCQRTRQPQRPDRSRIDSDGRDADLLRCQPAHPAHGHISRAAGATGSSGADRLMKPFAGRGRGG